MTTAGVSAGPGPAKAVSSWQPQGRSLRPPTGSARKSAPPYNHFTERQTANAAQQKDRMSRVPGSAYCQDSLPAFKSGSRERGLTESEHHNSQTQQLYVRMPLSPLPNATGGALKKAKPSPSKAHDKSNTSRVTGNDRSKWAVFDSPRSPVDPVGDKCMPQVSRWNAQSSQAQVSEKDWDSALLTFYS